ncbi:hypothetical protein CEXT_539671 [Caerostris extrusa]|uniref:Uncharacterized protein n=1 Tax=Caerostris extrusa TaxID=172846 RepID=A0AAV4W563_CAEEX|nr:hypothetical protein CEXT_539671 [Caerostris extrusa]
MIFTKPTVVWRSIAKTAIKPTNQFSDIRQIILTSSAPNASVDSLENDSRTFLEVFALAWNLDDPSERSSHYQLPTSRPFKFCFCRIQFFENLWFRGLHGQAFVCDRNFC